jgi:hypothetical protein
MELNLVELKYKMNSIQFKPILIKFGLNSNQLELNFLIIWLNSIMKWQMLIFWTTLYNCQTIIIKGFRTQFSKVIRFLSFTPMFIVVPNFMLVQHL